MMTSIDYREQTKRLYHRGLPKAERESWSVTTHGGIAQSDSNWIPSDSGRG